MIRPGDGLVDRVLPSLMVLTSASPLLMAAFAAMILSNIHVEGSIVNPADRRHAAYVYVVSFFDATAWLNEEIDNEDIGASSGTERNNIRDQAKDLNFRTITFLAELEQKWDEIAASPLGTTLGLPPAQRRARELLDEKIRLAKEPVVPKITHFSPQTSFYIGGDSGYSPSISAETIDEILEDGKSPLMGMGQTIYRYSVEYGIDPALMLALWTRENRLGTISGVATEGYNIGSMVDTGGVYNEVGAVSGTLGLTFGRYASWDDGIRANFMLLAREYVPQGRNTPRSLTDIYSSNAKGDSPTWGDEVAIIADRYLRIYGDAKGPLLPLVRWVNPPLEDGIRDMVIGIEDVWILLGRSLDRSRLVMEIVVFIAVAFSLFLQIRMRRTRRPGSKPGFTGK